MRIWTIVLAATLASAQVALAQSPAAVPSKLSVAGREVFLEAALATFIGSKAVYTHPDDSPNRLHLMSDYGLSTRSDTADVGYRRFSTDNGQTWSEPVEMTTHWKRPEGMLRRYETTHWADPGTGILASFILQGILPCDNPIEGMKQWRLLYGLSKDGGRTWYHEAPIIHEGEEYCEANPLPGVNVGRNGFMIGDMGSVPIRLRNGAILQPIQVMPAGPDGEYHNPGRGYTYTDAAVLVGTWTEDRSEIRWRVSEYVKADPQRSSRGMIEPTVAEMPDGRVLMVMRGSNTASTPGYRWYSVSEDHGHTWSAPQPWRYHDGETFYSPSSMSQLIAHSNGRFYWVGNISPSPPSGNSPRDPLVIAEVHPESLLLMEETLCVIDERTAADSDALQLSNFFVREDRVTREVVVHISPFGRGGQSRAVKKLTREPTAQELLWTSDASIYRIKADLP